MHRMSKTDIGVLLLLTISKGTHINQYICRKYLIYYYNKNVNGITRVKYINKIEQEI